MSIETDSQKNVHEIAIDNLVSDILNVNPQNIGVMENFQSSELLTKGIRDLLRASVIINYARGNEEYQIGQNGVKSLISLGISRIWGTNDAISSIVEKQYPLNEEFPENPEEILAKNLTILRSLGLDLSLISETDEN